MNFNNIDIISNIINTVVSTVSVMIIILSIYLYIINKKIEYIYISVTYVLISIFRFMLTNFEKNLIFHNIYLTMYLIVSIYIFINYKKLNIYKIYSIIGLIMVTINMFINSIMLENLMNLYIGFIIVYKFIYIYINKNSKNLVEIIEKNTAKKDYINKNYKLLNKEIELKQILINEINIKQNNIEKSIDESEAPIFILDDKMNLIFINDAFTKMFNIKVIQIKEINIKNFLESKFLNGYESINIIENYKYESDNNCKLYCSDDKVYRFICMKNKREKKTEYICILNDITQSIIISRSLKESEEKYKKLMDIFSDGVIIHTLKDINYINDKGKDLFNISKEIKNINISYIMNTIIPKYKNTLLNNMNKGYEINNDKILSKVKTKNGLTLEIITTNIKLNDELLLLSIVMDITNEESAMNDIEDSQQMYKTLIQSLPEGIFIMSKDDFKYEYMNKVMTKLINTYNMEEINNIIEDYILKRINNKFKKYRLNDNKGIEIAIINIEEDKILGIIRKLDESEKANKLKEELEYIEVQEKIKTEFLANISQELKRPINTIFSVNQLLESKQDTYKSKHLTNYNRLVKQNCYRLIRLIKNMNDITQIENGFYEMNLINYDIVSLIESIVFSVNDYINDRGLEVIFDTNTEEKVMAIDPDKIERIVLNLLSNAIKFTNRGGKIYVNLINNNGYIKVSVKDTGVGIPKDKVDLIFERFGQVDKTLSRNAEGSGIGLSLVKQLIELHKGSISVLSEEGIGSEFVFKIPYKYLSEDERIDTEVSYTSNNVEKMHIEFADIYFE